MKKAIYLIATITALAACAAGVHAVRTSDPGTWTYFVPEADGGRYVWYTQALDGGPGIWTWGPEQSNIAPRKFGTAAPSTWQWVSPVIDADHGSLATSAGYLFDLHCVLTQLTDAAVDAGGSTPLYVMGFDSSAATQPFGGTAPIFGIVSGGLSSVGSDVTYQDEAYARGTVHFSNGLLVALSTTADTFTAPAAGNVVRCDAKLSANR